MTTIQVPLPNDLESFVADQVREQGHTSASEYLLNLVRAAQRAAARDALEQKLVEGVDALDRGEGRSLNPEDWAALRARVRPSSEARPS
jgi:Arc/MetJ-type ribon-helix-helix transcriptional regulator